MAVGAGVADGVGVAGKGALTVAVGSTKLAVGASALSPAPHATKVSRTVVSTARADLMFDTRTRRRFWSCADFPYRGLPVMTKRFLAKWEPIQRSRRQRGMRTSVYAFLALCLVALITTSCGSDDGNGAGSLPALEGREFWSTSVTDGGEPRALVDGTRITLRFNGDQIGASAGCNSMGGTFDLEGSTLTVSDLFMTEMGCDAGRHDQDDFVASMLLASPTIKLDGNNLTLTTSDATIKLLDTTVANPDQEIIGTLWTVTGFIDGQSASSFPIDEPARIEFLEDSSLGGFDGCAEFAAPVEVSAGSTGGPVEGDGEMQFGVIDRAPTADCPNPEYVEAFHQVFATGDATFTINGTNLTIVNSNGAGVTLSAQ